MQVRLTSSPRLHLTISDKKTSPHILYVNSATFFDGLKLRFIYECCVIIITYTVIVILHVNVVIVTQ